MHVVAYCCVAQELPELLSFSNKLPPVIAIPCHMNGWSLKLCVTVPARQVSMETSYTSPVAAHRHLSSPESLSLHVAPIVTHASPVKQLWLNVDSTVMD